MLKSRKNLFSIDFCNSCFELAILLSLKYFSRHFKPSSKKIGIKICPECFKIVQNFFSFQVTFFHFFLISKFRLTNSQQLEVVKNCSIYQKNPSVRFFWYINFFFRPNGDGATFQNKAETSRAVSALV